MFLGHYATGLAAKKFAPKVSLGVLFLAAVWLDLLWSLFLLLGWEQVNIVPNMTRFLPLDFTSYSLSHSLVMAVVWSVLFGVVTLILTNNEKNSLIVGALVVLHWFLNVITHRPDLYLLPSADPMGVRWGLGLWNSLPGTIAVEVVLFAAGIWVFLKSTKPVNAQGKIWFWVLCAALVGVFVSVFFMPVPKSPTWVAVEGQVQLVFVIWALWLDDLWKAA